MWVCHDAKTATDLTLNVLEIYAGRWSTEVDQPCYSPVPRRCREPPNITIMAAPHTDQRTRDRNVSIVFGATGVVGIGALVIGIVRAPSKAPSCRTGFVRFTVRRRSGDARPVPSRGARSRRSHRQQSEPPP